MKIVIVEDHKLFRDMLLLSCRSLLPAVELQVADHGREGVALCARLQPELVFLDLLLPDGDGLDLVPQILAVSPPTKVIALSSFTDEFSVYRALRAQVRGFIDKNEQPLDTLREVIETVLAGRPFFSPTVRKLQAALRADPVSFDKLLSDQEQKLLPLFGEGLTNEAVAAQVGLTAGTVKVHRRNIHRKLGIHSTPELMNYAQQKGFTRLRRH